MEGIDLLVTKGFFDMIIAMYAIPYKAGAALCFLLHLIVASGRKGKEGIYMLSQSSIENLFIDIDHSTNVM
jgi:hypothetical protein